MGGTLPKKLQLLLKEYASLTDQDMRAEFLIDCAKTFQEVRPEIAARPFPADHRVPGCESEAYVWLEPVQNQVPAQAQARARAQAGTFHFAVENPQGLSAKALAASLKETLDGEKLEAVSTIPESIVHDLFGKNISMGKGQGLMNMIKAVKALSLQALKSASAAANG